MPVNCSAIGSIVVLDMNDHLVTPAGFDQGAWICLVEDLAAGLLEAICIDLGNNNEFVADLAVTISSFLGCGHTVKSPSTSSQYCMSVS